MDLYHLQNSVSHGVYYKIDGIKWPYIKPKVS
jgi:hypothetical protein